MSEYWHSETETLRLVEDFHHHHARVHHDLQGARQMNDKIVREIRDHLKSSACEMKVKRLEFTGSAYEGVQIDDGEIEFDVMVILDGSNVDIHETSLKGYVLLEPTHPWFSERPLKRTMDENGHLSAQKLSQSFRGELQRCLNELPHLGNRIKLVQHGTVATQMHVYREGTSYSNYHGAPWYKVDMVPCVEKHGSLYVPKPYYDNINVPDIPIGTSIWRQSFSMEEKKFFDGLDGGDNGTRKIILRILKAMRKKDATLQGNLTSYHLKTALIQTVKSSWSSWRPNSLVQRLMDVMEYLEERLANGDLPNEFNSYINLLEGMSEIRRENTEKRLQRLRRKQNTFKRLLLDYGSLEAQSLPEDNDSDEEGFGGVLLKGLGVAAIAVGLTVARFLFR